MIALLSLAFGQTPLNPQTITTFDEEWWVWMSEQPPPAWPVYELPEAQSGLNLLPEGQRASTDRVVYWKEDQLSKQSIWLSELMAPYSVRSEAKFNELLPKRQKSIAKRAASGKIPFSRTELVQPNSEPIRQVYFIKSFDVEEPDDFVSLQIEAKFQRGLRIFLNGTGWCFQAFPTPATTPTQSFKQGFPISNSRTSGQLIAGKAWMALPPDALRKAQTSSVHKLIEHRSGQPGHLF